MVVLLNKPFRVLCKFTDEQERTTLAEYCDIKNVYAAGRLDYDSEGLLLLTDQGWLQNLISHPRFKLPKTYFVQVEGAITSEAVEKLRKGVELKDGLTKPAKARVVPEPSWLWDRNPPIRDRANIPTTWVELTICEGKNRQVRRMTAAVGFPTLRLIRTRIGPWELKGLKSGSWVKVQGPESREEAEKQFEKWQGEVVPKMKKHSPGSAQGKPRRRRR